MTAPDVVIVGMDQPELPAGYLDLFVEHTTLIVLGVQKTHGVVHLCQLRPYHRELGEMGPEDLVSEIRNAAQASPFGKWRAIRPSQQ